MLQNFKAYQLAKKLYHECEKVRMRDFLHLQLLRAASSVVLNLAEGSGKQTAKEQKRFYFIALGSLREVQAVLELSHAPQALKDQAHELGGLVYRLARG